jgi:hypothetical protein
VGQPINARWRYTTGSTTHQEEPGSSHAVYSLSVAQTGNALVFTDNNGAQYSGYISGLSLTGGNPGQTVTATGATATGPGSTASGEGSNTSPQGSTAATTRPQTAVNGDAIAQFTVEGQSAAGIHVRITGTLQLAYYQDAVGEVNSQVAQDNRRMNGTWIESTGVTGDIVGQAANAVQ